MLTPIRLGLTGGIGSGKSSVARILAACGAAVVDADAIARDLTAENGLALPAIAGTFGQTFVTATGALNREKMRSLAFADPSARQSLESIIHPLVAQETQKQATVATNEGRACIVFDIPLLVESLTWRQQVDHVLVVDCTPDIQIQRVMARSQLTHEAIEKIIATQCGRKQRLGAADTVIFNGNISLDELAAEVQQIVHRFGLSSKQHLTLPKSTA